MIELTPERRELQGALLRTLAYRPDDDEVAEWKSLNEVLVEFYRDRVQDPTEIDAAGEIEAAVEVLEDADADGLIEKYEDASVRDTPLRISRRGETIVIDEEYDNVDSTEIIELDDSSIGLEVPTSINSSSWTGLTQTIIDARNAQAVSRMINLALDSLASSRAGNVQIMQAAAYLKAAKALVDAPEPPSALIWSLISKAADLVGLVVAFYAIFGSAAS